MKVDHMRFIDRWLGVPLVFFLSILVWFTERILFFGRRSYSLKRTLFIELSEMGSAILADPAMRFLKKESKSEVFFAIFESNYENLLILNTVKRENIFTLRSDNLLVLGFDVIRFIYWCRNKKITAVIDLEIFSRFTSILSGLSGAHMRVGFGTHHDEGLYRGNIINHPVRYNPHVHISINFMSLSYRALGKFQNPYATPKIELNDINLEQAHVSETDLQSVRQKLNKLYPEWEDKRIILINPNASEMLPQRRWLPEYFSSVAKDLLDSFDDILIIATGAPSEKDYVQDIVNETGDKRCINSAGVLDLLELIPLYHLSSLMLTNDSGPAHFSAVTPLKVLVIMGPETPVLYGSLGNAESIYLGLPCSPCVSAANHRKTTCLSRPCITGIKPEWISEKIKTCLLNQ